MYTGELDNPGEEQFKLMADTAPVLLWISGPDKLTYFFNSSWLRFTGRTLEQELGNGWSEGVHPDDLNRCLEIYTTSFDARKEYNTEYRLKRYDGQYRWVSGKGVPRYAADGTFAGFMGTCMDVDNLLESERMRKDYVITNRKTDKHQLEQIINMLPACITVIRGNNLVVETTNQANLNYWKKQKEQVLGKPFLEILPDMADQPFADQLREVMLTGKSLEVKATPVFFIDSNGFRRETYVDYSYQPLTDEKGEPNGVLVMSMDVTDSILSQQLLEKANQELMQSEARFKYFIMEAPVAIGILQGKDLIVESPNARILQVWGKTDSIIGLPLRDAIPELRGQPFLQILNTVFRKGIPFEASEMHAVLDHEGVMQELYFNLIYQPIKDAAGQTTDILVVAADVTEQVNARKHIEWAKESLRLAIEAAELGTYHINLDQGQLVSSPKLKEFFGFLPDDEMSYQDALGQIHPDHRQVIYKKVERAISAGEKFEVECPLIGRNDGLLRWVKAVGAIQHGSQSKEIYFTGVLNEITQKKLDEQRKNDFIAMVSHELKTPLTSISGMLQILHNILKTHCDPFVPAAIDKSISQLKKMNNMISGFLNVSQLESGKLKLEKTRFDLGLLTVEVIDDLKMANASTSFSINREPYLWVEADRYKISSVVTNFLSNAVKYSPLGANIEVNCVVENNDVRVNVTDHGMGVTEQSIPKIFERFYRVESKETKNIAGFGIGLYLCKEIVSYHDGQIGVESQPGKGSTFWFTLPLCPV
jgi:two-component system sensor histidine kinase VicK